MPNVVHENGHIKITDWLRKYKFYYKDNRALITYDGIKPGDLKQKRRGIALYPPDVKGDAFIY